MNSAFKVTDNRRYISPAVNDGNDDDLLGGLVVSIERQMIAYYQDAMAIVVGTS